MKLMRISKLKVLFICTFFYFLLISCNFCIALENLNTIGKYQITAKHSKTNTDTGITELEGDVKIKLPEHDFTLTCNNAFYFLKDKRAEAFGNVIMSHKDYRATSNKALFYEEGPRVVLTRRPVIMQGENTITAQIIEFWRFLDEFHFRASNNVKAHYYSKSGSEHPGYEDVKVQSLTASSQFMHAVRVSGAAGIISETVDLSDDVYVHLLQDNIIISSNKMNIRQPEDIILAEGNVNFISDDINSSSGKALLDNKSRILTLSDSPVVIRGDDTLSGKEIVITRTNNRQIIDINDNVVASIIDEQGKITEMFSRQAHAVRVTGASGIQSDTVYLDYDVKLLKLDSDLELTGDKAIIYEPEGKAEIYGNIYISWQDASAKAGRANFYRENERVELFEIPVIIRQNSTITGVTMSYWTDGDIDFIKVSGSARIDYKKSTAIDDSSYDNQHGIKKTILKADIIDAVRLTESASMKNLPGYVRPETYYMTGNVDLKIDRYSQSGSDQVMTTSDYAEYHRPEEYALAIGNVVILHDKYTSYSGKAEFWIIEDSVLLTGDPVIRDMSDPEFPVETKGEKIRVFKQKKSGFMVIYCETCEGNTIVDTQKDPRLKRLNIKPF